MRHPFPAAQPPQQWFPGQPVEVNLGKRWFPATITAVSHRRIHLTRRASAPAFLPRSAAPWQIRPAPRITLTPVSVLRGGDQVVVSDGQRRTVAARGRLRDLRWLLAFTDGTCLHTPSGGLAWMRRPARTAT